MGGGRYDGLVELYGGPPTPAMGFGSGIERIVESRDWSTMDDALALKVDVAVICLDSEALKIGISLANSLRWDGIPTFIDHQIPSLKAQLGQASSLRAKISVIVGEDELKEGAASLKNMLSGTQEKVPLEEVKNEVIRRLSELATSE